MGDTTWQEAYVANLHTMITALDEHVTKEDAIRILLEQVDELATPTELEGATEPAPEGTQIATAGQFAARWNLWNPEQREAVWVQIRNAADDGYKCFMEDHAGLKEQLSKSVNGAVVLAALRNIGVSLTDPKAVSDAQRFSNAKQGLSRLIDQIEGQVGQQPAPKPVQWIVEYAHPNCPFCEGAAEEAIAHAEETGAPGATAVGIAMDGSNTVTDHAATVVRAE